MTKPTRPTTEEEGIELHSGAWERFERTMDKVAKAPPAHRTGKPVAPNRPVKRAVVTAPNGAARLGEGYSVRAVQTNRLRSVPQREEAAGDPRRGRDITQPSATRDSKRLKRAAKRDEASDQSGE